MNDEIRSYHHEDFIARIAEIMPDLRVEQIRRITQGQNNDVLVVNNAWIFRFPRTSAGAQSLIRKATVLNHLHSHLPIAIPNPEFHGPAASRSGEFMAYRLIPGRPLTRSQVARLLCKKHYLAQSTAMQQLWKVACANTSNRRETVGRWFTCPRAILDQKFPVQMTSTSVLGVHGNKKNFMVRTCDAGIRRPAPRRLWRCFDAPESLCSNEVGTSWHLRCRSQNTYSMAS